MTTTAGNTCIYSRQLSIASRNTLSMDPSKPPTAVPSIGIPTVVHSIDPSFSITRFFSQLAETYCSQVLHWLFLSQFFIGFSAVITIKHASSIHKYFGFSCRMVNRSVQSMRPCIAAICEGVMMINLSLSFRFRCNIWSINTNHHL